MRFLLPHERWLAGWMLRNQGTRTPRNSAVLDLEQKYGPRGIVWMDAYFANLQFVGVFGLAGLVSVFVTPTYTSQVSLYLLAATLLFLALGAIRLIQAVRTGRKFRHDQH
jgi:hypothetical protein